MVCNQLSMDTGIQARIMKYANAGFRGYRIKRACLFQNPAAGFCKIFPAPVFAMLLRPISPDFSQTGADRARSLRYLRRAISPRRPL